MNIQELMQSYLEVVDKKNKNLVDIAFDEMNSSQYEEAASHFDQLYVQDSNDFMSYFFRAYCKSHCGTRGNVYPDSQKLTSAFDLACKKALALGANLEVNLYLIFAMYDEAMKNLADNAVEEVRLDSNGNTVTSNPTKTKILLDCRTNLVYVMKENSNVIKSKKSLKEYVTTYLKRIVNQNLKVYGPIIVAYEPEYATILEKNLRQKKLKQ